MSEEVNEGDGVKEGMRRGDFVRKRVAGLDNCLSASALIILTIGPDNERK